MGRRGAGSTGVLGDSALWSPRVDTAGPVTAHAVLGGGTGTSHHRRPGSHGRCGADGEKLLRRSCAYTQLKGPGKRPGAQTNKNCLLPPTTGQHSPHLPPPPATDTQGAEGAGEGS